MNVLGSYAASAMSLSLNSTSAMFILESLGSALDRISLRSGREVDITRRGAGKPTKLCRLPLRGQSAGMHRTERTTPSHPYEGGGSATQKREYSRHRSSLH